MNKNYSYVSYLSEDTYTYGIVLLNETLKQVNSQYPLHIIVTKDVSAPCLEILSQIGVTYELVDKIPMPQVFVDYNELLNMRQARIWKDTFTKFNIFKLTQFDKIVFLDADVMILKNIDHLFDCAPGTAAVDGEYFNIWPEDQLHFNAGCMVIEPSEITYDNLINYIDVLKTTNEDFSEIFNKELIGDQNILNLFYSDWKDSSDLHLNKYYNIFGPYIMEEQLEDIKENAYFIHFIGRKPWAFWVYNPAEHYSEYFYTEAKNLIQNYVQSSLDLQTVFKKVKIAVYAICKNEIQNVDKWLDSFGVADYVCVLDTGSTDGTWERLQARAAASSNIIIKQQTFTPWRFDTARNVSMTLIPEDAVIMFMADLDEEIKESDWPQEVRKVWSPTFTRGQYTYNRDVGENGEVTKKMQEYRIHSRFWNHWKNVVHESLYNDWEQKDFLAEQCTPVNITVWHFPTKSGPTNYADLCELDIQESPNNFVMRLQAAIEYEILRNTDKAMEHFKYIIENENNRIQKFELARCYYGVGRMLMDQNKELEALSYFFTGIQIAPYYADNYFGLTEHFINHQKFQEANDYLNQAERNCMGALWCSVYDINAFYVEYYKAICEYYTNQDKYKALGYLTMSIQKNSKFDGSQNLYKQIVTELLTGGKK